MVYSSSFAFCSFILFRIAWWPPAGKELSSWLSACAVLLYAVLTVFFFSRLVSGTSIVSVPDRLSSGISVITIGVC